MKAYVPDYEVHTPRNLGEALACLAESTGGWKPLAGGTDLMVLFEAGTLAKGKYLNIWGLEELRCCETTDKTMTLGALTTYSDVLNNPILQAEFPMLCEASRQTGSVAVQNRGTLGGNIMNASPAADSPPALLAYGAEIELASTRGRRWIDYKDFHTAYKQTLCRPDELLTRIRLSRYCKASRQLYRKVGTRRAQAISKVCFSGLAGLGHGRKIELIRLAFASVAPIPLRCIKTESSLLGREVTRKLIEEAKQELGKEISPIDDIRSTRSYRYRVAENLLVHFLESL